MIGRLVYWLAVLVVSGILVIGLILVLESRDQSSVEEVRMAPGAAALS